MMEMFQLDFMVYALAALVVSGLLLSYLGTHVVRRGIVFVDLALGQISMLGVAVGAFFGWTGMLVPLIFTLAGALLMSLINVRDKRLKQEAIIGIFYAFSSALTVLFISKTPHGDADVQEVLFGSVLAVAPEELGILAIVFGALGLFQAVCYERFRKLTEQISAGEDLDKGLVWNTFFFLTIGVAIVLAVRINGVIPVFSFLIIPVVSAMMIAKKDLWVNTISLCISVISALLGLYISFHYDFPAGASVVSALGFIFVIAWTARLFIRKGHPVTP